MRRLISYILALAVAGGVGLMAQKAQTPEDLDRAMKRVAQANGVVNKSIQSMAYADAKKSLAIVEEALGDAHNFWVVNKKDDAVAMSKDAMAKVDALDAALSASAPDQPAVLAAMKQLGGTCAGCHKAYREQDANQQYQLKAGSI
jgi:hypothetical protein